MLCKSPLCCFSDQNPSRHPQYTSGNNAQQLWFARERRERERDVFECVICSSSTSETALFLHLCEPAYLLCSAAITTAIEAFYAIANFY